MMILTEARGRGRKKNFLKKRGKIICFAIHKNRALKNRKWDLARNETKLLGLQIWCVWLWKREPGLETIAIPNFGLWEFLPDEFRTCYLDCSPNKFPSPEVAYTHRCLTLREQIGLLWSLAVALVNILKLGNLIARVLGRNVGVEIF